jgi:hypothetical protein
MNQNPAKDLAWAVDGPPVGVWTTSLGTADAVLQDVLCLLPNGTGFLQTRSALRGIERFPVMWKHPQAGALELAMLLPGDDPNEEPEWEPVRYASAEVEDDTGGRLLVLRNTATDGFWSLAGPVKFLSAPPPSIAAAFAPAVQ